MSENKKIPLHTFELGAEYLAPKKNDITAKEMKHLRQYVANVMTPEGLNDFWYYFFSLSHPEQSDKAKDDHQRHHTQVVSLIKGIRYEEYKGEGITYFAHLDYYGPELTATEFKFNNTIPTVLHLLRINIASRLRYELTKIREQDKKHSEATKTKPIRISTAVIQNIKPLNSQLQINNDTLPKPIYNDIKQRGLIEWHNSQGQGFNLDPFCMDIVLAILEINANKSETVNTKSPLFYLGNYEGNLKEGNGAHVTATVYEIAKTIHPNTRPNGLQLQKVFEALRKMHTNPKLWPLLVYPIHEKTTVNRKGQKVDHKTIITTYKPVLEVYNLYKTETIEGETTTTELTEVLIRLNEVFVTDIKKRWIEIPGNYFEKRTLLTPILGRRPDMLSDFLLIIRNAKSYSSKLEKDNKQRPIYKNGLIKNADGLPGLYYKLGLEKYERIKKKDRFYKEFNKSIEYLKGLGEIEEYAEHKDEYGNLVGWFVFPAITKKAK